MRFHSSYEVLGRMRSDFHESEIKNEPMFFSCSLAHAFEHGGPITKEFVTALPNQWNEDPTAIFDSRVHMLMPGWLPCIPGWHHDDVPRRDSDGQPDYANHGEAIHILALVNGDVAPTELAVGSCSLHTEPLKIGRPLYGEWHEEIETLIAGGSLTRARAGNGFLIAFDWQTFHRGVPAVRNGWRWFGRVSRKSTRRIKNELRRQVQVYLPVPNEGW